MAMILDSLADFWFGGEDSELLEGEMWAAIDVKVGFAGPWAVDLVAVGVALVLPGLQHEDWIAAVFRGPQYVGWIVVAGFYVSNLLGRGTELGARGERLQVPRE